MEETKWVWKLFIKVRSVNMCSFLTVLLYFKYFVLDQRKTLSYKQTNFTVETYEVFRNRIMGVCCTTWKDRISVQNQKVVDVGGRGICNFWIFYLSLKWLSPYRNSLPKNVVDACVIIYSSLSLYISLLVLDFVLLGQNKKYTRGEDNFFL